MAKHRDPQREAETLATAAAVLERSEADPEAAALADEAADAEREAAAPAATMVGADGTVRLTFDQLMQLVKASQTAAPSYEQMVEFATKAAHAGADRIKPKELTITQTERKSAFNPEGERDNPRPKLKCHMYFGAAPLGSPKEVTTLTHAEITALNALTPGHFRIKKMDGSFMVIEVKGQVNSNRQLDRLWILLPEGDDQKNLYPPLAELAAQCGEGNRVDPVIAA